MQSDKNLKRPTIRIIQPYAKAEDLLLLSFVTENDIDYAIKEWEQTAPEKFKKLLNPTDNAK